MRIKKEYLILAIVIVALGFYLILGRQDQPGSDLPGMTALENTTINRMVITKENAAFELVQKDDRWFIMPNNYPVDRFKIKNMIKAAAELTLTALVSQSGNYQRYGLNDSQRIKVQVFKDDRMQREFKIGRVAPGVAHTFVLLANDTKVYHAKGRLNGTFELTLDSLRDKTALSFDKATIATILIQNGDQRRILNKTETIEDTKIGESEESSEPVKKTQWQWKDGVTANESTITALLNSLSALKCDAYMADDAKAGLSNALWTITLKNEGSEHTLSLFTSEEEAAHFPGISSYNDFAFLLSKSRVETLEKQMDALLNSAQK